MPNEFSAPPARAEAATGARDARLRRADPPPRDAQALRGLLPIDETAARDTTVEGTARLVRMIARALRSERRRGRAGHWSYALHRHLALARLYRDEASRLAALTARGPRPDRR